MSEVGQRSDFFSNSRIGALGVPIFLVLLATLMVLLNGDGSSSATWLIPLAVLGIVLVGVWQRASIVSLGGLGALTLIWAVIELPGSPGILMIAPLLWMWIGRSHRDLHCYAASAFAVIVALGEGVISLSANSGTAVDLVGNVALVALVGAVGLSIRHVRNGTSGGPLPTSEGPLGVTASQPQAAPAWLSELSRREREVLAQLVDGASNNEIAENLHIGLSTVKTHVSSILRKAEAPSRYAVALALRPGPTADLGESHGLEPRQD